MSMTRVGPGEVAMFGTKRRTLNADSDWVLRLRQMYGFGALLEPEEISKA